MMNRLLDDARSVAKGASAPAFSKDEYEDEMLRIAQAEARAGESQAVSFSRMISDHDPRMMALYKAARKAAAVTEEPASREEIAKAQSAKDLIFALMSKLARGEMQAGETEVQAFNRLVRSDREMRGAYAMYRSLS